MLAMSLVGIIVIIGFTFYFLHAQNQLNQQISQLDNTIQESKAIDINMAKARQYEKSFLGNPQMPAANHLKTVVGSIEKTAKKWQKNQTDPTIAKKFSAIDKAAKSYLDAFNGLVASQQIIGLSANDGLRKTLNGNMQTFQKIIGKGYPKLEQQLYQLKMYQTEYIANQDSKTYNHFNSTANNFGNAISSSNLPSEKQNTMSTDLLKYTNSFNTIHGAYQSMNQTEKSFETTAGKVEKNVSAIVSQLENQKQSLAAHQSAMENLLTVLLIIVSLIVVALLAFFGIWLLRAITKSIDSLKNGATVIGQGNLAYRVQLDTDDEMGDLAKTFNAMAEKMQRSMQKVLSAADHLSSSSQNLAAVSEETTAQANEVNEAILQVSAGAQNQAEHLEESTELISSVTFAVDKTAAYGDQIAGDSANAEKEGKAGLETVNRLNRTSEQFIDLTSRLIEEVQKTNEQSKKINSIVQTIKEIAGNTDLLALNAAIESARAGEAGKGFAVVAQEVRKLAERSKTEAQNIQKLVKTMSGQMAKLSDDAERLNEYRNEQGAAVSQTKNAFETIVGNVGSINERISGTQESIKQVATSNKNLSAKLEEVSAISEESAASAEQVSAASDHQKEAIEQVNQAAVELQNIAMDLQQEVSLFQLTAGNAESSMLIAETAHDEFKFEGSIESDKPAQPAEFAEPVEWNDPGFNESKQEVSVLEETTASEEVARGEQEVAGTDDIADEITNDKKR